jgi:hypothetical protein
MKVIEENEEFGLRLSSRTVGDDDRSATLYEVHQLVGDRWLGIGNDDSSGLEAARTRFQERLAQLQGTPQ